jgi:hypothetical protein
MRKAMWLLKSFGTHTSLVLDMTKANLHGMPIFLAKGAMELRFGTMSSKEVRSTVAIGIILGNPGRYNKLRSVNTKNWYRKGTDLWAEFGNEMRLGRKKTP